MTATLLFGRVNAAVGYAQVIVERGLDRYPAGLTYGIPTSLADLAPGDRVIVPLGAGDKPATGYVLDRTDSAPTGLDADRIKFIKRRDNAHHRLPPDLLHLAQWMSAYYCTPVGMVMATMLPGPVKRDTGRVTRTMVDLAPTTPADAPPLSRQQRAVMEVLSALTPSERPIDVKRLAALACLKSTASIRALMEKGILSRSVRTRIEAEWSHAAVDRTIPESLTDEQSRVVNDIGALLDRGFSTHLLHGVTGSGKTEVYIRLIERIVAQGKTALVLVPEIALTPQTGGRLVGRFPHGRVAVLHSGLTAAQRNQQWTLVASGDANVVLGARSAVFAPIPAGKLGLIIVDEEHDGSYKQDQLPRYHGRDVAIRRAQLTGCPVLLGSATPSLESWWNASADNTRGTFSLHRLTKRVPGTSLPAVRIVDFRVEMRERRDRRIHLIGPTLETELRRTLDDGFQALLLLNRRGYANYLACPDTKCGWVMTCDQCDTTMVLHRDRDLPAGGFTRCHHCESEQRVPRDCPQCGKRIVNFGLGTQRVEDELTAMFPSLIEGKTLERVDSDSMTGSSRFHDVLGRFARRELKVLVGTQMIAKGLDFPGVRLVGVINADTAINLPDFRAAERTFQLVSQVAGRSGRGETAGRVVVQSFNPAALPIRLAAIHDYDSFAGAELAVRRRFGLPPMSRLTRMVIRHEDLAESMHLSRELADGLRSIAATWGTPEIRIKGPAPCPIARIANKHRQQVEVFAPTAKAMQELLTRARNADLVKADALMAVDVDPIALL